MKLPGMLPGLLPGLLLAYIVTRVSTTEWPVLSGHVTTLSATSEQMYKPFTLRRSLLAADGTNAFLVADSAALVKISAAPSERQDYTVTQLTGHPVLTGYVDGDAPLSRFSHITDFAQNEDGSKVYIVDQNNHCIRLFDRTVNNVAMYAGNCTEYGQFTGPRLSARFSSPTGIAMSHNWTQLYIADQQNNRILRLDLMSEENWVETVIDNSFPQESRVILPTSIAMSSTGETLYLTTENGLTRITEFAGEREAPVRHIYRTSTHTATIMLGLALIQDGKFAVVTELEENRVLFIDLINGGVAQICTGQLTLPFNRSDGSSAVCEFNSPQGVVAIDSSTLFVTEHNSRVLRRVSYQLPSEGITTIKPPTTTPFVLPSSSEADVSAGRTRHRPSIRPTTNWRFEFVTDGIAATTVSEEVSPLILGLSAGILIPLVLVGALVSLISYIKIQGKRQAKVMYARRTDQGGYNGPQFDDPRFQHHERRASNPDQPPSYTPTYPYSASSLHSYSEA